MLDDPTLDSPVIIFTSPDAISVESPVLTITEPDRCVEDPVDKNILPLLSKEDTSVFNDKLPALNTETDSRSPTLPNADKEEDISTEPPVAPLPEEIMTDPPCDLLSPLDPADKRMSPDSPETELPVDTKSAPEEPADKDTSLSDIDSILPLDSELNTTVLLLAIFTDPPDKSNKLPITETEPPRDTPEPSPASIDIDPPEPTPARPDPLRSDKEPPTDPDPLDIDIEPPSSDANDTEPPIISTYPD